MTRNLFSMITATAMGLTLAFGTVSEATIYSSEADSDTWVGFHGGGDFGNREADSLLETQGGLDANDRQQRAIMRWDLSSIGSSSTVTSATLTMRGAQFFNDTGSAVNVEVRHIVAGNPWTEGGVNWFTYDGTNNWANTGTGGPTGGSFAGSGDWLGASAHATIALPASSPAFSTFGSDPVLDITSLVQQWVSGSLENNGLALALESGFSASDGWIFFNNADNSTPGTNVLLSVEYEIPEPASLGLLGAGVAACLLRRRK